MPLALSAIAWTIAGALILFGALVVLSFTLRLARETKQLAERTGRARERLEGEMAAVTEETREARERLEGIRRRRRSIRRR